MPVTIQYMFYQPVLVKVHAHLSVADKYHVYPPSGTRSTCSICPLQSSPCSTCQWQSKTMLYLSKTVKDHALSVNGTQVHVLPVSGSQRPCSICQWQSSSCSTFQWQSKTMFYLSMAVKSMFYLPVAVKDHVLPVHGSQVHVLSAPCIMSQWQLMSMFNCQNHTIH
jgi:hypothetical protein